MQRLLCGFGTHDKFDLQIQAWFSGAQLAGERWGGGGGSPLPSYENLKKRPDFGKNTQILFIYG